MTLEKAIETAREWLAQGLPVTIKPDRDGYKVLINLVEEYDKLKAELEALRREGER